MKPSLTALLFVTLLSLPAVASSSDELSSCDKLIALLVEIGERSGQTVTEEQARAEVMSENPSDAECAAMLALFEVQQ